MKEQSIVSPVNNHADVIKLPKQSIYFYFDDPFRADATKIFQRLANCGFDSVIYMAKNYDGRVAFESQYADMAHNGLEVTINLAAEHNMRVYANLMTLIEGYSGVFGDGRHSKFLTQNMDMAVVGKDGHTGYESPHWCDRGMSHYCCPSSRAVRERIAAIACEVALTFPVAGIHLDCFRYPLSGDYCFCERCKRTFRQQTGEDLLQASHQKLREWRCSVMFDLVTYICTAFRKSTEDKTISALVWRGATRFDVGQDWSNWPVDFVTPMYYQDHYYKTIRWVKGAISADEKLGPLVVPALGGNSKVLSGRFFRRLCSLRTKFKSQSLMIGHYDTVGLLDVMENESKCAQILKDLLWLMRLCKHRLHRSVMFLTQIYKSNIRRD